MDLSNFRGNHPLFSSKFEWIVIIEMAGGMELIGKEDSFGWDLNNIRDNSNVSILLSSIEIHQECKIRRKILTAFGLSKSIMSNK